MNFGKRLACLVLATCLTSAITLLSVTAWAAADHYVCVIKNELFLEKDGTISVRKNEKESFVVGQRFVVDRVTGVVRGSAVSNENAKRVTILDKGSKVNSFHMYWGQEKLVSAPFSYLHIQAFIQPKSPFYYIGPIGYFSGICD